MAEPDHTALARLSGRPDNLFIHLPIIRRNTINKDELAQRDIHAAIAGIEEIKLVVTSLLADSDVFSEVLASDPWIPPRSWPLPATTYASLLVAIHYLDQCAGMFRHELHR